MDISKSPYSEPLLISAKKIEDTIGPSLKLIKDSHHIVKHAGQFESLLVDTTQFDFMKSPLMDSFKEQYRDFGKAIPSSILELQKGFNLPSMNVANQIATIIPKPVLPKIGYAFKPVVLDLSKFDFRINVLHQEVSNNLSALFEKTSQTVNVEKDGETTDFNETFLKSSVYAADKNQQANEIAEIKDLLWQVYKRQDEQLNQTFENDIQEREQNDNSNESSQVNILALIGSILTVLSLITAPKEIYEFLIWIDQIISFLLNK